MIDKNKLREFLPKLNQTQLDALHTALEDLLPKYGVTTPRRIRYFLAQAHHETQGFTALTENLNYKTADRIAAVWPKRFTKESAKSYIKNPQKLANKVYANRMGNGDESSGDGWAYRGRGAGHLTGKTNYAQCSQDLFDDDRLVKNPDLVAEDWHTCVETFLWFWDNNGLNKLADNDEFTKVTKVINGSTTTVPERLKVLAQTRGIA